MQIRFKFANKLRQLLAISLSLLLLMPSIGVHIDVSKCCGLESVGFSHSVTLDVSSCCAETEKACHGENEIVQAPTYQDLATVNPLEIGSVQFVILPFASSFENVMVETSADSSYELRPPPLEERHPSLYSVFLC